MGQWSGMNGVPLGLGPERVEGGECFLPQDFRRTKVIPLFPSLCLFQLLSLSRKPRELPQTLTAASTQGGRPAALISSVQLSSWNQVGRLIINCNQVLQATQWHQDSQAQHGCGDRRESLWLCFIPGNLPKLFPRIILGPSLTFFFFFATWLVGILVPQPGIEPMPPALEVLSTNHWVTRDFLVMEF